MQGLPTQHRRTRGGATSMDDQILKIYWRGVEGSRKHVPRSHGNDPKIHATTLHPIPYTAQTQVLQSQGLEVQIEQRLLVHPLVNKLRLGLADNVVHNPPVDRGHVLHDSWTLRRAGAV